MSQTEFNSSDQFHLLGHVLLGILPSILDQLVHINVHSTDFENVCIKKPPIFTNLKHLKLQIKRMHGGRDTFYYFPAFWKCPSWQKLEIKYMWRGNEVFDDRYHKCLIELDRKGLLPTEPHNHLNEVTLSGFIGCLAELSFSWCLLGDAVVLEKLLVELCDKTPEIRQRAAAVAWDHFRPGRVDII